MSLVSIARVAVDQTAYHYDKPFDYIIPENLRAAARPGCRVTVPFGGGNRTRQAIILECLEGDGDKLKMLLNVPDEAQVLTPEFLMLAQWLKETCFCTLYEAVRLMLPTGISLKLVNSYAVPPAEPGEKRTLPALAPEDLRIVDFLTRYAGLLAEDKLARKLDMDPKECEKRLRALAAQGILLCAQSAVQKMNDASVKMVRLTEGMDAPGLKLTDRQKLVADLLRSEGDAAVREVCYYTGVTPAVVQALVQKGCAEYYEAVVSRSRYLDEPDAPIDPDAITLTDLQQEAFDGLLRQYRGGGGNALLYGVTGSGKTSVFLKLIHEAVRAGDNVILMVPEIALTPQLITLFHRCFGRKIAVLHSGLSLGERMDEWKRIRRGEAQIAIGTRSAVFAPFEKVGLIVMDEEQEASYKSESAPRYHARDVARFRCGYHKGLLLLSSATPSMESRYHAQTGRYRLYRLPKRYSTAGLPQVEVIDMNEERDKGTFTSISPTLAQALEDNLRMRRQSIVLLNRRGYNTFLSCGQCGEVVCCPNCSISLTYHAANHRMMCHYCGYSVPFTEKCPYCSQMAVRYAGAGTQRAEEELVSLFPDARILRMDTDTTMARYAHEEKLAAFAQGKYDIMIGTQMVAKGLDFPNVTLVGILSADQALYGDDFRCYERAFSLLTQVIGRSGRGKEGGRAMIQTLTPENPIIPMAATQDYETFYRQEIALRQARLYPPFADLCVVGFSGEQELQVRNAAKWFLEQLIEEAKTNYPGLPLRVIGPAPASVYRVNQKFRYKILLKCRGSAAFRKMMAELLVRQGKNKDFTHVSVYADMNPDNIL